MGVWGETGKWEEGRESGEDIKGKKCLGMA